MARKATGRRGSWFASVDGVSLPCIHKYWLHGMIYSDPFDRDERGRKKQDFIDAIQRGRRVILTDDVATLDAGGKVVGFRRTKYIAIYDIEHFEFFDDGGLRLHLSKRVEDLI